MAKKIDWTNHIIEFVTVVIGILLAFGLNNYNQTNEEKSRAVQHMDGIEREMEYNLKYLEKKYPYHKDLLDSLQLNPSNVYLSLQLASPKNNAWELAQNETFKRHSDLDTYYELAQIYGLQDVLNETNKNAGETMIHLNVIAPYYYISAGTKENAQKIVSDPTFKMITRRGWIPVFQDITNYELELINLYKDFLKRH